MYLLRTNNKLISEPFFLRSKKNAYLLLKKIIVVSRTYEINRKYFLKTDLKKTFVTYVVKCPLVFFL